MNKTYIQIIFIFVAVLLLGLRFWLYFNEPEPDLTAFSRESKEYIGVVDMDPDDKELQQVFTMSVEGGSKGAKNVRLRVYAPRYPRFSYGDRISATGKVSKPRSFKSENGKTFDYENFLKKDDIYFELKGADIRLIESGQGSRIVSMLFGLKHSFLAHIKSVLGEPHSSLAGGLVVGEKSALGKDLIDDFRRTGLIHIVVLSGYNITIVATAIRRMLIFLPKRVQIVLGAIFMIMFCILVGGGATVVRSCIMAMIALLGEFVNRGYGAGRALFIAGYLMLFQNPSILLYDPSFQLSFLATLALILLASPMEKWFSKWPKFMRFPEIFGIRGLIATTLATQIFVSPFIFYLMGQISIIGVLVNILVLPIIPVTMLVVTSIGIGGFVYGAIGKAIMLLFSFPAHLLLSYEIWTVRFFSHIPYAVFELRHFSFTMMCVVYGVYALVFIYLRNFSRQQTS